MNDIQKENKKMELRRLIIYLVISFGLAWLLFFVFIPKGKHWDTMPYYLQSFISLGMLMPVIAHFLTRLITKEGFSMMGEDSMMFGISFRDKKWICFLIALFLPWVYTELGNLMSILICRDLYDPEYYQILGIDKDLIPLLPINGIISGAVVSFAAFGEEGGWRGYMMPKLMKLMGTRKAFVAGGIIWGLWHAPLTCIGHNFGTDYPGFPYVGIAVMCMYCVFMGILLTFLTVKSGSVWPAALMHAINNTSPSILNGYVNYEKADAIKGLWSGRMIPMMVLAVLCLIFWKKMCVEKN